MECIIIHEIVEITLGITVLILFFSKRFPIMYKSRLALVVGIFFLIEPVADVFIGKATNLFEFIGAVMLLIIIERFIAANTKGTINPYPVLLSVIFGLSIVILKNETKYLHAGELFAFALIAFRLATTIEFVGWAYRDILLLASFITLFGIMAFLSGFIILSSFLYFEGIFLMVLVLTEIVTA